MRRLVAVVVVVGGLIGLGRCGADPAQAPSTPAVQEDSGVWDCTVMGNRLCE